MRQDLPGKAFAVVLTLASVACGDDALPAVDASVDTSAVDSGSVDVLVEAPAPPAFGPCPDGFREVEVEGGVWCEPWAEAGRLDCPPGQAHWPGTDACAPLGGVECPADGWPAGLPTDGRVLYVDGAAPDGGDGTREAPYNDLSALLATPFLANVVVALHEGVYERERVALKTGITLWGACPERTELRGAAASSTAAVSLGFDATLRNVRISTSPVMGVDVLRRGLIENVQIDDALAVGLSVDFPAALTARNIVVRGTREAGGGSGGNGVSVTDGGTATMEHVFLHANQQVALFATGPETSVTVTDLVVADTAEGSTQPLLSRGIGVQLGARLEVRQAVLERNHDVGIAVLPGSTAIVEDVILRDTLPGSAGDDGVAVASFDGSRLELRRARIDGASLAGIFLEGTSAIVEDVVVTNVGPRATDGIAGVGLAVYGGTDLTAKRLAVHAVHEAGISVFSSDVDAEDVRIERIAPQASDDNRGIGIEFNRESTAVLRRVAVRTLHGFGILAGIGSNATLEDLTVETVSRQACAERGCEPFGIGIAAVEGAAVDVARFEVVGAALCGVFVIDAGALDLRDGLVRDNEIGACVQVDGYDVTRLQSGVRYLDNASPLDSTTLPLPAPGEEILVPHAE